MINIPEDKETIVLICFDPNYEIQNLEKNLHRINDNDIVFHINVESCIKCIQSIQKQNIILITSSCEILSHIIDLHQILSIFIFTLNNDEDTFLSSENSKIIDIYTDINSLSSSIQKLINFIEKSIYKWCFFPQDQYTMNDLSNRTDEFVWLHLFHDVLSHLCSQQLDKRQKIHSFYHEYQINEAIQLFLQNLSLQQIINEALRTKDTDQLYNLRYFLYDLIQNLSQEHQQIISSIKQNLIVYRTMNLTNDELKRFQDNKHALVSMKGFFTANINRATALTSSIKRINFVSILFEIECSDVKELTDNFIFIDITRFTELSSDQKVFLFDFNATFTVENVQQDEHLWIVQLRPVKHGKAILQKYIYDTRRQLENLTVPIIFGKLLCNMNQWKQSQLYFQHLLNDSHNEDRAWIEHSLGQTQQWKGQYDEARQYYDHAYNRMIKNEPIRMKDSAMILSDIGELLYMQKKYDESLDFHQRALEIREKYYISNHPHIAISLRNIGNILTKRKDYHKALDYCQRALLIYTQYYSSDSIYIVTLLDLIGIILTRLERYDEAIKLNEQALVIQQKYYGSNGHKTISLGLICIGCNLVCQNKLDEALNFYQWALLVQKTLNPSNRASIALILYEIADILRKQRKYDEAFNIVERALTIQKSINPPAYKNIGFCLNLMGDIQYKKRRYVEAISFYEQALAMYQKTYLFSYEYIVSVLQDISHAYFDQRKFDEAVDQLQRVIKILEEMDSTNHTEICRLLELIASIFDYKGDFDRAIEYYNKCLKIKEANLSSNDLSIVYTLIDLINIHKHRSEYELRLIYELQCFSLREKIFSPNDQNIAKSLFDIGNCFHLLNQHEPTLDYYKQALAIYEQCIPYNDEIIETLKSEIQRLSH